MEPTKYKQLVTGDPNFVGVVYTVKEGTGRVVGKQDKYIHIVFRLKWPHDIQDLVCTKDNPNRTIIDSYLEMSGLLFF